MNDPQEKSTKNPYHINYKNYLDTHGIDSREQWESFRQIFDFMPVPESQDLTDKQD